MADLAARYMSAHVAANCNAHTAGIYRGSLDNHILPALGVLPIGAVERAHVAALHYRLRDTPRAANRALMVLSKMFARAAAWGLGPESNNPCRSVRKYKERKRERVGREKRITGRENGLYDYTPDYECCRAARDCDSRAALIVFSISSSRPSWSISSCFRVERM